MPELRSSASSVSSRAYWMPRPPATAAHRSRPFASSSSRRSSARIDPHSLPPGASLTERASAALRFEAELGSLDAQTDGLADAGDIRVYVFHTPAGGRRIFAEGVAAETGDYAFVEASVTPRGALLTALAVAHEALHCVGASDKYDAGGHARESEGLVDPAREPRYPQARAEIMVGERPLAPGRGALPERADQIGVGVVTAREIGWLPSD